MKKLFYNTFSNTVTALPFIWNTLSSFGKGSLRIVYYHLISEQKHDYYFHHSITPQTFRKQIKFLKTKFEIISLYEAMERIRLGESLSKNLCITFDDGFSECYSIIAPILVEEKVTATFFLIENTIENKNLMWRNKLLYIENKLSNNQKLRLINQFVDEIRIDSPGNQVNLVKMSDSWEMSNKDHFADILWRLAGLEPLDVWLKQQKPYMTIKQIKELIDNGFQIGAHTKTHPKCNELTYPELEVEITGSIDGICRKIGVDIDLFAYPFGKRAKPEYEAKLVKNTNLKCMLGVMDNLSNFNNPLEWERCFFETYFSRSMIQLLLIPIKRKLLLQIR